MEITVVIARLRPGSRPERPQMADRPQPGAAQRANGKTHMEQRGSRRVVFERGYDARLMAIDGTWHRACQIKDISETGAKLSVESSIEGLPLKEFFLVLSSTGTAFRRCELAWVN